jgi:hypothetical protein
MILAWTRIGSGLVFKFKIITRVLVEWDDKSDTFNKSVGLGHQACFLRRPDILKLMLRHQKQWGKTPKLNYASAEHNSSVDIKSGSSEHNSSVDIKSGDRDALAFFSPICDALIVVVGLMQLIEALFNYASYSTQLENQSKKVLRSNCEHWRCILFELLRVFGPVVYLQSSAIDFKCELDINDDDADENDDKKYATRRNKRSRNVFLYCRRELVAAAAAVIAALLCVISAICKALMLSLDIEVLETVSVHLYLVSAMLTMWRVPFGSRVRYCPWYFTNAYVGALGDATFGVASLVDVCLHYSSSSTFGAKWYVVSAFFWTCSSWCYVISKRIRLH